MNMQKMLKQVQKMQADMARVQEELKDKTVEAAAGGGAVKVVANGHLQISSVTIAPEAVDPEDVEMLQDLVLAAVNEALRKAQEMAAAEMAKITGGMNIPGLPNLV
ncbi:MAG: YbaB/EbfC family nucleoid-associated protein [Syntrophothermus sp.]